MITKESTKIRIKNKYSKLKQYAFLHKKTSVLAIIVLSFNR